MDINAPPDVLAVLDDGVDRKLRRGAVWSGKTSLGGLEKVLFLFFCVMFTKMFMVEIVF